MTFLWAGLLAGLIIVPLLVGVYVWSLRRRRPVAARYSSLSLVHAARPGSSRLRRHLPFALLVASVATLAMALGRPAVVMSVPVNGTTVILALDVSGSMCSTDIAPTRLAVAKEAAARFVADQTTRTRIGVVAFSGLAAPVVSPTVDQERVIDEILGLGTDRRTAVGSGILVAIDSIAEIHPDVAPSVVYGRPGTEPEPVVPGVYAPAIIVVLTDGASNAGEDPILAAEQAETRGIRVYTIGYGTDAGGQMDQVCRNRVIRGEPGGGSGFGGGSGGRFRRGIDEDTLIAVSDMTGGTYFPAASADELVEVFSELPTSEIMDHEAVEVSAAFVGAGALLCGVALLLGRAWRPLP